ncbi:MAG: hypothetical protein ACTSRA_16360 [Promethearchaeota archaeon]
MIRLIIFDFGDTLFHSVNDDRAKGNGRWEVLERDGKGRPTRVASPNKAGMAEATFDHVQEVLHELRSRGIWLSVASSADVIYVPQMVEAFEMCSLFRHAFMARGDWNKDCSRKGDWIKAIIHDFNIAECQDDPIQANEVLFVDDLVRCLNAAKESLPGINLCLSMPRTDAGLRYIFEVIEEINGKDEVL